MKRVFTARDPATMTIVQDLLAQEGIETRILNECTASALGEIPFTMALPELWALYDEDEPAARELVRRFVSGEVRDELPREPWACPDCGEEIEGQFTECWHCSEFDPRGDPAATCLTCGYLLWSLPERRCPECGNEF